MVSTLSQERSLYVFLFFSCRVPALRVLCQGLPEAWSKLLTKSAITREDYQKDPQAVLDVLEFYTDHQKREMEEISSYGVSNSLNVRSGGGAQSLSPYDNASAPRFNAGTGLGGATGMGKVSPLDRPQLSRQDSAPAGLNGDVSSGPNGTPLSSSAALARAAEFVSGSQAQHHANTISAGQQQPNGARGPLPALQPSRPAPPRPLLTANRPAPPAPLGALPKPPLPEHTPSSADLLARAKAQGPPTETRTAKPPGLNTNVGLPARNESLTPDTTTRPTLGAPAKSSPATTLPASHPAAGAAGSTVGPPPVKPLQPVKKPSHPMPQAQPALMITPAHDDEKSGSVAAAAAALEKPKEKEKRISTMNEAQIMEKLRSVVSQDDPKQLYSKIRKVGQG